jgi:hypothetical protein
MAPWSVYRVQERETEIFIRIFTETAPWFSSLLSAALLVKFKRIFLLLIRAIVLCLEQPWMKAWRD